MVFFEENVFELKVVVVYGQMLVGELEDVMNVFYEGKYNVLLLIMIVELGFDILIVNILIVYCVDMFGLVQFYQLCGWVGCFKIWVYVFFIVFVNKMFIVIVECCFKVLQLLEMFGVGFQFVSYDLDICGVGNFLGEEQLGYIKEVGFEFYQQMLEEVVVQFKDGGVDFGEE